MKLKRVLLVAVSTALVLGGAVAGRAPAAVAASAISPASIATTPAHVGDSYNAALFSSAGATWSVVSGQLPPGLALQGGQISGVPTLPGAYTFTVQAKDGGGAATKVYTILVNPPASTGYDARQNHVIDVRAVSPPASSCNHTAYLTYATGSLWLNDDVADVNNKITTLKSTQIGGDPQSCGGKTSERDNLHLSYLIRPYMLYNPGSSFYPGQLTAAASNNLVSLMWTFARAFSKYSEASNPWLIFDSENHDAQAESFYFLAAQIFKDRPDYKNKIYADGSTVAKQYKAWHDHWSKYLDERAKHGLFIESGAPRYAGYTLQTILNIYDFADDPILRRKAGMVLDLAMADYAQRSLKNVWAGAKSRSYPENSYNGTDDNLTNFGNLLFGSPTPIDGDNHILALATSGYYPPPVVTSLATGRAGMGSFTDVTLRPGYGPKSESKSFEWTVNPAKSVVDYAYVTPSYVMGTAELNVADTHVGPSAQNRWQGITFNTTPGDRVYPQAAPTGGDAVNDAFVSVQSKNVLITEKRFALNRPTVVFFANSLDAVVAKNGWLFVKEGSAYLAVRPASGTYKWMTSAKNKAAKKEQRFIVLSNAASPIIFQAGPASSFPSFTAFQTHVSKNARTYTGGVLKYSATDGTKITFYDDLEHAPRINSQPINYAPTNVYNSPFMTSKNGSGKITITHAGHKAVYDFSHINAPTRVVS